MENIVYREFSESDAPGVVRMWKDSMQAWPPGFFGASDITEDTVLMEERSSGKLSTVLALLDDRVIGYCMTSPYGGEPDASYVNLINVVPDMHGRGIGKKLLLDAVVRSADLGLYRIDLHTWPANMKAVPLYKKTGFFWVPNTEVYMQNYMPFILGRPEFRDFLEGEDWYSCFRRELLVEQDLQRTDSGREVFTYWFRKDDSEFLAEFDRRGRRLSRIEYPGFSAMLEADDAKNFFVGREYGAKLSGRGFELSGCSVGSEPSISCAALKNGSISFVPESVRLGKTEYEPADRLTLELEKEDLALSIGVMGVEEVSLYRMPLQYLPSGASEVKLDLKKMADVRTLHLQWSLENASKTLELELGSEIYQSVGIDLPVLEDGIHELRVKLGEWGYTETVILVVGQVPGKVRSFDTRKHAILLCGETAVAVSRKGGRGSVLVPRSGNELERLASFFIGAGPPTVWNSDLPKQNYELEIGRDTVSGRTDWPSRPGMVHRVSVKLHGAGFVETAASVENGSGMNQKVHFAARVRWTDHMRAGRTLVPLPDGTLLEPDVYNQVPDMMEDFTGSISNLGAPWFGRCAENMSIMQHFAGWTEMEYFMPGTEEATLQPGGTMKSPAVRILAVAGDHNELLRKAGSLGWQLGSNDRLLSFYDTDLKPIMASGSEIGLGHPLYGSREASILIDGKEIASGKIMREQRISGRLDATGLSKVGLSIAGRTFEMPVILFPKHASVVLKRTGGDQLVISNGRMELTLDPGACGHVHSLRLDDMEYLYSAHPEPGEFCWEKPWFGGIIPRLSSGDRPYPLQDETPWIEEIRSDYGGLDEGGFRMGWSVDHREYGSLDLAWSVSAISSAPAVRTVLECTASSEAYPDGGLALMGYLQPGGSREEVVMTCESFPNLAQGRGHKGAWSDAGKWARLSRGESFVEAYSTGDGSFFSEDYGEHGCHLAVFERCRRKSRLEVLWLFGSKDGDDELAGVFRAHT